MQHHSSEVMGGTSPSASAISSAETASSCPIAFANAIQRSMSFLTSDFVHDPHLPMIFTPRALQTDSYLSQTDLHSCKTTFIPFSCPLSFGSLWFLGKHIFWVRPRVSSSPGAGSGLHSGIVVSRSFLCFPLGFIFMLFTLRESSAQPSCAEDRLNTKTPILFS